MGEVMRDEQPVIKKFIGGHTKRLLYKVEYSKCKWPEHGLASIHLNLEDAKKELEDFKTREKQ
jgi:hypothetical protein